MTTAPTPLDWTDLDNKAVDTVRKAENRALFAAGDKSLAGSKYLWLYSAENLPARHTDRFAVLRAGDLKTARAAHQGDKSPLALANREIGALPPSAKAEAGKRVGQARGQVAAAFTARQGELEVERDERILVDEAIDVTLPGGRRPLGHRHLDRLGRRNDGRRPR